MFNMCEWLSGPKQCAATASNREFESLLALEGSNPTFISFHNIYIEIRIMRWNNELDKKLTHLVLDGKDTNEIANELNITCKCVTNRIFRLGIKILKPHRVTIKCKFCGKSINKTISDEKQFCNRSCSGHYNSKGRKHSEKTKEKIRLKNTGKIYPSRKKQSNLVKYILLSQIQHIIRNFVISETTNKRLLIILKLNLENVDHVGKLNLLKNTK